MKQARLSIELRSADGSIGCQSIIDYDETTSRFVRHDLKPGEEWTVPLIQTRCNHVAMFAAQSRYASEIQIGTQTTILEGEKSGDFAAIFARRGNEFFGAPPWAPMQPSFSSVTFRNLSDKLNRVDLLIALLPEQVAKEESAPAYYVEPESFDSSTLE